MNSIRSRDRALVSSKPVVVAATSFAVLAVFAATSRVNDPDVWWIATAGRDMLATGHVPFTNLYSFAEGQRSWVMHEWLFGPLYATGLANIGPSFFALVTLGALTAGFATIAYSTLSTTRRRDLGLILASVLAMAFNRRLWTARPSGPALVLGLGMTVVAFSPSFSWLSFLLAVGVEWAWANAHGSFPLGIALLLAGAVSNKEGRPRRALAVVAATLVTLVNPYGWRLHQLVGAYSLGDADGTFRFIHRRVAEFQPIWRFESGVLGPPEYIGFVLVALLALTALACRVHLVRALTACGLALLAVLHVRHVEQFGLIGWILLVPHLDDVGLKPAWAPANAGPPPTRRSVLQTVGLILSPGLVLGVAAYAVTVWTRPSIDWIAPNLGGPPLVTLARGLPNGARAFVPWESSGLLLWFGAQQHVRTLVDSRNDCYSAELLQRAFRLVDPDLDLRLAEETLDRYSVDQVLVPERSRLSAILSGSANWRTAGRAAPWVRFDRNGPPRGQPAAAYSR